MKKSLPVFVFILFSTLCIAQEGNSNNLYDKDLLPASFHRERREALRKLMPEGSLAVFFAAPERNRSNDVNYQYHQNPDFYYLTGIVEPNAVLLITKDAVSINGQKDKEFVFVQEKTPYSEVWLGKRLGVRGTRELLEFSTVFANSEYAKNDLDLSKFSKVLFNLPSGIANSERDPVDLYDLVNAFQTKIGGYSNLDKKNLDKYMAQLRQIKQPLEIALLQKAIDATCIGINDIIKKTKPGMYEYQAQAIAEFHFKDHGAEYQGYPCIVGAGENGCILHYETNRKLLLAGELLLTDVGAEYHGYSADVTRTMPINKTFTPEQKTLYELVLKGQEAGIAAAKKGNPFSATDKASRDVIAKGLVALGIVKTEAEARKYFPHGTSHYLGLDVHDAGDYGPLQANQVITVEPGIYIPANSPCDKKWWNIGIRIEDDILITETGNVNLSACVPKTVKEIEALRQ